MKKITEIKFTILLFMTIFLMVCLFILVDSFREIQTTKKIGLEIEKPILQTLKMPDSIPISEKNNFVSAEISKKKTFANLNLQANSNISDSSSKPIVFNIPAKKDSTQRTILLTGDSMGDGLFYALRKVRKENNIDIKYDPWYGSTSGKWASVKRLQEAIEKNKPDLVIFTMGANELFIPLSKKRVSYVQEVLRQFGNIEFVWVGSPNWKKDWGTDSMFHANIGSERYFVSKDIKLARNKDGAHPTFKASEFWMDSIMVWVNQNPKFNFKFYSLVGQEKIL
ncbi:MAG: hypothetical protein EAZ97_10505 [Bacteroidetes bacterium]|nr:MAG: hypothetical protein EAZ97_10505 [Bacteroidota bacterium]